MATGSGVKLQPTSPKREEIEQSSSEPRPLGPTMFPNVPDSNDECSDEQHSDDRGDGGATTSTSGTPIQHGDSTGLV